MTTTDLSGHEDIEVDATLNGKPLRRRVKARQHLADFLRQELELTGTHLGCEHGICGACTVRVDGVAQRSCMQLAVQADGRRVDTVEGLNQGAAAELGDLQAAFKRHHALQCGFCTAGILMSCSHFLERVPAPSEQQVRDMLSGHLCRCTGYTNIVNAVLDVAAQRQAAIQGSKEHA